jgi:uncharacterized membrane protein
MDNRPRLVVVGERLGPFGGETAFSGRVRPSRSQGPEPSSPAHRTSTSYTGREFVDGRDIGRPEVTPVYRGGRTVRFSNDPQTSIPPDDRAWDGWDGTRVRYLQHASDPIVWWSPQLITHRPDWLDEPRGDDAVTAMRWIPLVTFWQVSADLPFATKSRPGTATCTPASTSTHGRTSSGPPGRTQHDAEILRAIIAPRS